MNNKKISILGCGWYGFALAKDLLQHGYQVKGSTTSYNKLVELENAGIKPYLVNFDEGNKIYDESFFDCDILFIAIPPKGKSVDNLSYPNKIALIALAAEQAKVKQIVLISSTGVYQDGNFIVTENDLPQPNSEAGKVLLKAEQILKSNVTFTTTIIRFAGLIGPNRNLAKYFSGRIAIANGLAPINLIHLNDCVGLSVKLLKEEKFGLIYHGVSPSHPTRSSFYTTACIASGLTKPKFLMELLEWKKVESKNVPEILAYEYVFKEWDKYFKEIKNP